MFNQKLKSEGSGETTSSTPGGASLIAAGTTLKGDITSNGDIRIDGTLLGNMQCTAKVIIGANGVVEGDITGQQADIMGKVNGTIKVKELLQLKGGSVVSGNLHASKLQIEPSASFNGQCHYVCRAKWFIEWIGQWFCRFKKGKANAGGFRSCCQVNLLPNRLLLFVPVICIEQMIPGAFVSFISLILPLQKVTKLIKETFQQSNAQ
jgi:cytoskeletal protein CcmA (bactofilin family)